MNNFGRILKKDCKDLFNLILKSEVCSGIYFKWLTLQMLIKATNSNQSNKVRSILPNL